MKWIKLTLAGVFLFSMLGCATGEWMQHDTMYKNWDHLKFSWTGFKAPTMDDAKTSTDQRWWGQEVPVDAN